MRRTVLAVLLLASALVACGGEDAADPARDAREAETLLVRAGASLVAVDTRAGASPRSIALGAHDASLTAVYTAEAAGSATTVVATDPVSGRRLRSIELPGRWTIPVAAGTTPDGAVSGDGAQLVLAGEAGGGSSHFALLGTDLDSQPRRFSLRGRYEFDAMAPDGSVLYLNEVRADGRYRVRSYDVASAELLPRVVVEKTALGLLMEGEPVARAVDPSGSPVHTLYRGGPAGAFVHSLNTAEGTALCILVPDSRRAGPEWRLALDTEQGELHALNRELAAHYLIDPVSGEVRFAPADVSLPGLAASSPDGGRTYTIEPDGTIAVRDAAGARTGTLPLPDADAELLAVRD
jgi:hypothetical protein